MRNISMIANAVLTGLMALFLIAVIAGYARSEEGSVGIDTAKTTVIMEVGDGIWMEMNTGNVFMAPSTGFGEIMTPAPDFGDYLIEGLDE